jgi:hypothetical protein
MSANYVIPLVLFVLLAHPVLYKTTRGVLGNWVANSEGRASLAGLILHAVIFVAIVGYIMKSLNRSTYVDETFPTRKDQQQEEYAHWIKRNELQ